MVTPLPEQRAFVNSDLMSRAIRMVIPMKREFSVAMDVPLFLRDFAYAKEVLDVAMSSQDTRLRDNAVYLESKIFGSRSSMAKPKAQAPTDAAASPASKPTDGATEVELTEDEMRARMMSKYKTGLR